MKVTTLQQCVQQRSVLETGEAAAIARRLRRVSRLGDSVGLTAIIIHNMSTENEPRSLPERKMLLRLLSSLKKVDVILALMTDS